MFLPNRTIGACLLVLLLGGCEDLGFVPYDYETLEDAKFKIPGCDVKIHGKELKLEKKIKIPVKHK